MDVWRDFLINFQRRGQRVAGVANPSVDFTDASPRLRVTKIFKDWINTYVTLATKFRNIFKEPKLRHSTAAESRKCLGCPDMKYSSRRFLRQPRLWNLSRDLWQGHAVSTTADRSFDINSTCISRSDGFCIRWVEFWAYQLYPVIQRSIDLIIITMHSYTKGFAMNSE